MATPMAIIFVTSMIVDTDIYELYPDWGPSVSFLIFRKLVRLYSLVCILASFRSTVLLLLNPEHSIGRAN